MLSEEVVFLSWTTSIKQVWDPSSKEAFVQSAHRLWRIAKASDWSDSGVLQAFFEYKKQRMQESISRQQSSDAVMKRIDAWKSSGYPKEREIVEHTVAEGIEHSSEMKVIAEEMRWFQWLYVPAGHIRLLGAAKWARNGFPQVTMSHKFAAALLATGVGKDTLEQVSPPWDSFLLDVPNGLLAIMDNKSGQEQDIQRILVVRTMNETKGVTWSYVAFGHSVAMCRLGATTEELLPPEIEEDVFVQLENDPDSSGLFESLLLQGLTDQDKRVSSLLGRLIINTCLAMSDPENIKAIGTGHKSSSGPGRSDPEPVVRTYQVGRPVKLDCREYIAKFVRGGARNLPSVQTLVRGHFKSQPHGPKSTLRKVIWREPFWRGPEDAPILTRPHEMK